MSRIVQILELHRTDWSRSHWAYAKTDCGHSAEVVMKPHVMECVKCGAQYAQGSEKKSGYCDSCGCGQAFYAVTRDAHKTEDRVTAIGDEVECPVCGRYQVAIKRLRNLDLSTVSHSRFRDGLIRIYTYDSTSPTGVSLEMSIEETPEVQLYLRGSLSPLSPTETR